MSEPPHQTSGAPDQPSHDTGSAGQDDRFGKLRIAFRFPKKAIGHMYASRLPALWVDGTKMPTRGWLDHQYRLAVGDHVVRVAVMGGDPEPLGVAETSVTIVEDGEAALTYHAPLLPIAPGSIVRSGDVALPEVSWLMVVVAASAVLAVVVLVLFAVIS